MVSAVGRYLASSFPPSKHDDIILFIIFLLCSTLYHHTFSLSSSSSSSVRETNERVRIIIMYKRIFYTAIGDTKAKAKAKVEGAFNRT